MKLFATKSIETVKYG